MDEFIEEFMADRLARRLLVEQHIALHDPRVSPEGHRTAHHLFLCAGKLPRHLQHALQAPSDHYGATLPIWWEAPFPLFYVKKTQRERERAILVVKPAGRAPVRQAAVARASAAQQNALGDAAELCENRFGSAPVYRVEGPKDAAFTYIPAHLEYVLLELFKNAARATMERQEALAKEVRQSAGVPERRERPRPSLGDSIGWGSGQWQIGPSRENP
jgi:hypothetical protein